MILQNETLFRTTLVVAVTAVIATTSACGSADNNKSMFDDICDIYTEIAPQARDLRDRWSAIAGQIEEQFPTFAEEHYRHIMNMDPEQKYPTFKALEKELVGSGDWSCPAMEEFYLEMAQGE